MPDSDAAPRNLRRAWGAALLGATGMIGAAPAALAADGQAAYAACAPCHGPRGEGVPATGAPVIAGLDAAYVERQLRYFAAGSRGAQAGDSYGAMMRVAAAGITDDGARAALGAYIARLPRNGAAAGASAGAGANDNGRNYWNALCSACHGANGRGNQSLGAPRLAGAPPAYLARQFAAFKAGYRGAAADDRLGAQMRAVAAMLPDARTETDVLAYVASLAP
jgi:cytochrome c oxidase subunit II